MMSVATTCIVSCFLLSGCNGQKQIDSSTIEYINLKEDVHLEDNTTSPAYKMTIDYAYLAEKNGNDTIAHKINHTVQSTILGKKYAEMEPQAAIDSFKNVYVREYRNSVADLYKEDIKNGTSKDELPSWYNYEYSLTTQFKDGKEGVLNYTAVTFEYSGGAHPNQWENWLNFDKNTGKRLTLKDVFMAGSETPMSKMLLEKLIKEMATKLDNSNIQSLEDLQNEGILNSTNMYVPDNFLLEKNEASFLYNKYDIAPYAMGTIVLSLPYAEIEKYMIHQTNN